MDEIYPDLRVPIYATFTKLDLMYYANFTIFSDVSTSVAALFLFSAMMKSYYLWLSSRCKSMDTITQLNKKWEPLVFSPKLPFFFRNQSMLQKLVLNLNAELANEKQVRDWAGPSPSQKSHYQ